MAKNTDYTYDRAAKRCRKNGKWSKPPKRSQLKSDTAGRPVDATGKRVPLGSFVAVTSTKQKAKKPKKTKKLAKPKKAVKSEPKKQPKKAPKGPQKRGQKRRKGVPRKRKTARKATRKRPKPAPEPPPRRRKVVKGRPRARAIDARYTPEGSLISEHELLSSTFQNRRPPYMAGDVLFNLLREKAQKTFLDPDDIVMYKFGIQFQSIYGRTPIKDMEKLISYMAREHPEFSFLYHSDSVHVLMGSKDKPILREEASKALRSKANDFVEIWSYLEELWDGDIGWFVIAENDEVEGGS